MANMVTDREYKALNKAAAEHIKNGRITTKCPRCGKELIYETHGSMEVVRCKGQSCIKSIRRGI